MDGRFPAPLLVGFAARVLEAAGARRSDALITARVLVEADLRGIDSHGVARLPVYARRLKGGLINPRARLRGLKDSGSVLWLDAQNGLGPPAAARAMGRCLERAATEGLAMAAVRNSNHFGIAGYYAMMALDRGMIGVAMSNASPLMAPWGGRTRMLGTNPLAVAIPGGSGPPVVMDMATSQAARGKLEVARRLGRPLPPGWALGPDGRPTTDPAEGLAGLLLPMGAHKGYCLAVVIEALCGALTGGAMGPEVGELTAFDRPQGVGHAFIAIDPQAFVGLESLGRRMDEYGRKLKADRPAEGVERIYLPGEIEHEERLRRVKHGVPLPPAVRRELAALGAEVGVEVGFLAEG
ncbi:MAG: Ldh family oxidoreductase [Acetobacteraceae bacterium]|nr:Ldh family oxidoreductase [Acetobacteraceae bacterium]